MAIAFRSVLASSGGTAPDGSTVTPINDIQILLHCANIWNSSYTTINELLDDTRRMAIISGSPNAINYLVRSTQWALDVSNSMTFMLLLGGTSDAFSTLWADSTWQSAFASSPYINTALAQSVPIMTSDTTPSGEAFASSVYTSGYPAYSVFNGNPTGSLYWSTRSGDVVNSYIGYTFTRPVKIYKIHGYFDISQYGIKDFKVQYKNSQDVWVDVPNSQFTHTPNSLKEQDFFITPVESASSWRLLIESNYYSNSNYVYHRGLQFLGTL